MGLWYNAKMRWILHVDMDEFFVAVERLYDESLAGKCVLIGSKSPRSVLYPVGGDGADWKDAVETAAKDFAADIAGAIARL